VNTSSLILIILFAAVGAAIIFPLNRRYRRLRKRFDRLERRTEELLQAIKPAYTARATAALSAAGRSARFAPVFRSQFGEDLFLFELFSTPGAGGGVPSEKGYYIECGGYDGWTYAVTAAFDAIGWDGLLVEPIPSLAESCRRSRPNARVVQAALSVRGSTGTAKFTHLTDSANKYDASSFLADARDEGHTKKPPTGSASLVEVPLTTMDNVLSEKPPKSGQVDFAVIDVEGAELSLLDGFELAKWKPRVILIEDHSMGSDPALLNYLSERGYEHVTWISYNRLMIRREETALIERARDIAQHTAAARAAG
jgi:FkbM family methyltransferase